jgi:hypothetical protein
MSGPETPPRYLRVSLTALVTPPHTHTHARTRNCYNFFKPTVENIVCNSTSFAICTSTFVGIRHADHVAPSIRKKLALTSLTSGGRSVGVVRLQTEATELTSTFSKLCKNSYRAM